MIEKVECVIEHDVQLENDEGQIVIGVTATCTCCDTMTEAFGTTGASVRRCLAQMREECPEGEHSFYYADDGSDSD